MDKVLVDRDLLESIASDDEGVASSADYEDLKRILAQPAEAEVAGEWEWLKLAAEVAEEDGPWEPRLGMTDCETAFAQSASPTLVLELLATLSAVTAERDQSISLTADYIAMLGEAGLQIDQLTAERDALAARLGEWERSKLAQIMRENVELTAERDRLREAVELLSRLRGLINCTPENDVDKVPVWISTKHPTVERIDALLAAMAAKEA